MCFLLPTSLPPMSSYILHKYSTPPVSSHPHTLAPPYQSRIPNAVARHPHILARLLGFRQTIPLSTIHSHNEGSSIQWANITLTLWTLVWMVSMFLVLNELASFPGMPCLMFYRECKPKNKKWMRPRNEAMLLLHDNCPERWRIIHFPHCNYETLHAWEQSYEAL